METKRSFGRRIAPLSATQFFGVFNDNAFKVLSLLFIFKTIENPLLNAVFMLFMAGIYVIPALIGMAPAGFLADRWPKRYVILLVKIMEIVLLLLTFPV